MSTPPAPARPGEVAQNTIAVRFGDPMLEKGHTAVPNLVLQYYAQAGITTEEMMFTIQVWAFWWTERDPFPSLEKIAMRMGVSLKTVRRYSISLQHKALLKVTPRIERGGQITNEYDFSRLLRIILLLKEKDGQKDTPTNPQHKVIHNKPSPSKKPAATASSPPALPKLGGGRSPKTGRGRRRIPEQDINIDQIDSKNAEGKKRPGSITPRPATLAPSPLPPEPEYISHQPSAERKRRGGITSLSDLLARRVVIPASQLPPPPRLDTAPDTTTLDGPVRAARAPYRSPSPAADQSPRSQNPGAQRGTQRATARIAQFVRELGDEHGDTRHQANISQIGGLFARSGLSEQRFLDWLYTTCSELRDYHRTHPRERIKRPMAYFYSTLRRRLGL